jgi:cytochrome c-type biogenesis protein CcmH/NrfG
MSAPSWFMAGLIAGAATMLGAVLLWRVSQATIRRRRGMLFAGSLAAATLIAGISFAVGSHQGETIAPGEAAMTGSQTATMPPSSALPADSSMPSAAMMAQVLAMPRRSAGSAEPMEEAAAKLATRLERGGGSAADWNLLAQAYDFLGRADDARHARARAAEATSQSNP